MPSDATGQPPRAARRGRPPSTRAQTAIRGAATALFTEHGFAATSVRDIASAAGVDPAVVIRHFGSKDALFLETMSVKAGFRGLTEGPVETLGRAILGRLLEEKGGEAVQLYSVLLGALDRAEVRTYVEQSIARHIVDPLSARLDGPDRQLRARLIATQIVGLLTALRALRDPALLATPTGHLLDAYAPAIQALIDTPALG